MKRTQRLFLMLLAFTLVIAALPTMVMEAKAWETLPTELNGYTVTWGEGWFIMGNGAASCRCFDSAVIFPNDGTVQGLKKGNDNITTISQMTAGTYTCKNGNHTFTLIAPAQPKTGVMDTLPIWFGVMAVSACAYVLTSKKKVF